MEYIGLTFQIMIGVVLGWLVVRNIQPIIVYNRRITKFFKMKIKFVDARSTSPSNLKNFQMILWGRHFI